MLLRAQAKAREEGGRLRVAGGQGAGGSTSTQAGARAASPAASNARRVPGPTVVRPGRCGGIRRPGGGAKQSGWGDARRRMAGPARAGPASVFAFSTMLCDGVR